MAAGMAAAQSNSGGAKPRDLSFGAAQSKPRPPAPSLQRPRCSCVPVGAAVTAGTGAGICSGQPGCCSERRAEGGSWCHRSGGGGRCAQNDEERESARAGESWRCAVWAVYGL
eukprot:3563774-Prymnesium_polylepis.1